MSAISLHSEEIVDIANSPVLPKIFNFLDWKSKKVVRGVCRSWKEELDDSGLNIKIDNGCCGNVGFASKALAKKINVVQIDSKFRRVQLRYPSQVISVKCTGKIEPLWFIKEILLQCENLTELYLTGNFLISQEIGNLKGVKSGSKILMQNLKYLRIEFGVQECEKCVSLQAPQGTIQKLISFWSPYEKTAYRSIRQILDTNLTFLLTQIRSPKLNFLYIFVDVTGCDCGECDFGGGCEKFVFEWKGEPIAGFLDYHHCTLTKLYLPNFKGQEMHQDGHNLKKECPKNLKTLEITIFQPLIESGPPTSFMQKLLLAQKSLEEIRFDNDFWRKDFQSKPHCPYRPVNFRQLFVNNASTLNYIHLTLHKSAKELLSGYTFQNCSNLATFILEEATGSVPSKFDNFNALPKSLKMIQINSAVVIDPELCQTIDFHKFKRLEILELEDIRVTPVNIRAFTATVSSCIMNALRTRRLNSLTLSFSNELLMIRDKNLTEAIVVLAKPTDAVDIYEPLNFLKISGSDICTVDANVNFLSIPPTERTDLTHFHWKSSGNQAPRARGLHVDEIVVRSNVYNVPYCGVLETCWDAGCRYINPALLEE